MTVMHALFLGVAAVGLVGLLSFGLGTIFLAWLTRALWRWYRTRSVAAPVRRVAIVSARDLQPRVIELAHQKHDVLTVADIVEALGVTQLHAQDCLAKLVVNHVCRANFELGSTSYIFKNEALPLEAARSTQPMAEEKSLLGNRYRIVRSIKEGGMGAVYEAVDTKLADSPCAIKEILASAVHGQHADYIQSRFFEEMKALVALDHPAIPKVRDYLTIDSTIYIVMELVHGINLEESSETPEQAVQDTVQLLDVLGYLHHHTPAIIHRDVKPANVIRDPETGRIKLVDFGLARQMNDAQGQTMVGTPGYCAPEQTMGKSEPRSDIYSAGVTLYFLLTRHAPTGFFFQPIPDDGLAPELRAIVEKATQAAPSERYASAEDMSSALQAWVRSRELVTAR